MNTHEKLISMGLDINNFIVSELKLHEGKVLLILRPGTTDSKNERFLDKIRHIIHENYHNPVFDVPAFAGCLGISKTLLNRKIRELEGISTGRFIHNYRLKMAKKLLLINKVTREKNISEIAYEAGFNDPRYFARCFRESFGILPSQL